MKQFKAAQYLRLAEEKGSKSVGNSWYVYFLKPPFQVMFILPPENRIRDSAAAGHACAADGGLFLYLPEVGRVGKGRGGKAPVVCTAGCAHQKLRSLARAGE